MLALMFLPAVAFAGEDTVIIGVEAATAGTVAPHLEALGLTDLRCWASPALCLAEAPPALGLVELQALPGVRWVERDTLMDLVAVDPALPGNIELPWTAPPAPASDLHGTTACPDLWDLQTIGLSEAWDIVGSTGTNAPVVAVLDGGFLRDHEDIVGRISGQWDYGNGDSQAELEWDVGVPAHGTFIGGIVAGNEGNGVGRVGIVPEGGLNLMKIADSSGALYWSYAINALANIVDVDLGIGVVNYSIASSSNNTGFEEAVAALADVGVVFVAAAGNCSTAYCATADNDANPLYPANYDMEHVLTVAGSTRSDALNSYSHYGASTVDLAAPGVDICSLGVTSTTDAYSAAGTSYAAPLVAGAVALLMEARPELSTTELTRVVRASALDVDDLEGKVRSGGRLDLPRALKTAVPRLSEPGDAFLEGGGNVGFHVVNPGAEGEATVVLFIDRRLRAVGVSEGWELETFTSGHTLELPDAGELEVEGSGALLRRTLPEGYDGVVEVEIEGDEDITGDASVRVVMSSEGADYLNAPYDEGAADETGFLALPFQIVVRQGDTGEHPTDTAVDTADSGGGEEGGDVGSDDDDGGGGADGGAGGGGGCGCTTTPVSGGLGLLALLPLVVLGRRRAR